MTRVRCIDIETSHEAPGESAGVVEIGWRDVVMKGGAWVVGDGGSMLTHPGCAIPPETSAIHHIIDADVEGAPPWREALAGIIKTAPFEEPIVALAAHNARFERGWCTDDLTGGLPWVCSMKVAFRMWPTLNSFGNMAIRYARNPEGLIREKAMPAHRAGPDAYVTAFHIRDQLNHAGVQLEHLIKVSAKPSLLPKVQFGKHRGKAWADVDRSYLEWIVKQADMDEDVKFTAAHWLQGGRSAA